ncbi:MAG: PD-(D/E)XK nuclease family transposase, partial [Bacilli bacterium]|nr:PD-(D/E)XK nuclease family transposase [Bacilli bacterium]
IMENEQILLNDVYFKCLFGDEKNKICLCCLLSEIMKEDYKYIYDNIIYINKDLGKINIKDTSSYVDILVKVEDKIINVEAYTSYDKTRKNKNINYLSKLCLNYYNNKNNYDNKIKIIQINLIKRKYRDVHYIQGKKIYTDIISIIEVGIDNKDDLKYTKSEHNLKLWCDLLNTKVEEIDKVFKIIEKMKYEKEVKEKMRKEVYDKMSDINLLQTTWDDLKKLEILDAEKAGKKAGLAEGKKLVKNTIFKHIMKMLKMNMKYSDISEITGVSVEKIQEYTHEIDLNDKK